MPCETKSYTISTFTIYTTSLLLQLFIFTCIRTFILNMCLSVWLCVVYVNLYSFLSISTYRFYTTFRGYLFSFSVTHMDTDTDQPFMYFSLYRKLVIKCRPVHTSEASLVETTHQCVQGMAGDDIILHRRWLTSECTGRHMAYYGKKTVRNLNSHIMLSKPQQ